MVLSTSSHKDLDLLVIFPDPLLAHDWLQSNGHSTPGLPRNEFLEGASRLRGRSLSFRCFRPCSGWSAAHAASPTQAKVVFTDPVCGWRLGPPSSVLLPFAGGGFPYQNRLQKKGTLVLTSLLEDLGCDSFSQKVANHLSHSFLYIYIYILVPNSGDTQECVS